MNLKLRNSVADAGPDLEQRILMYLGMMGPDFVGDKPFCDRVIGVGPWWIWKIIERGSG